MPARGGEDRVLVEGDLLSPASFVLRASVALQPCSLIPRVFVQKLVFTLPCAALQQALAKAWGSKQGRRVSSCVVAVQAVPPRCYYSLAGACV